MKVVLLQHVYVCCISSYPVLWYIFPYAISSVTLYICHVRNVNRSCCQFLWQNVYQPHSHVYHMMMYNIMIMIKNLQGHELIILEHWSTLFPKDQHNWLMRKYSCLQLSEGWSSIKVSGGVSDWHKTNIHHSYHKYSYNFFHPLFCQLLPCSYIANKIYGLKKIYWVKDLYQFFLQPHFCIKVAIEYLFFHF